MTECANDALFWALLGYAVGAVCAFAGLATSNDFTETPRDD